MDFTSGTSGGPRLDAAALAQADLGTNMWGSLTSATEAQQVAEEFHAAGWSVRRSSWTTFEITCACAEFELIPSDPVLFSGFVDPDRIAVLLSALRDMGMRFTVEFEDGEGREHVFRGEA
ncbi:hypothetical protein ACFY8O_16915 [Streptomyces argenteolus]|uniref:Uncharacterized protein n=1 Tax=Streptomyces argenteolus TaxID=67274 RepID=A0ABW6X8E5_9ACTN